MLFKNKLGGVLARARGGVTRRSRGFACVLQPAQAMAPRARAISFQFPPAFRLSGFPAFWV